MRNWNILLRKFLILLIPVLLYPAFMTFTSASADVVNINDGHGQKTTETLSMAGFITNVIFNPTSSTPGTAQSIAICVYASNIANGTAVTANLLDGNHDIVATTKGTLMSNTANLTIAVASNMPADSYSVQVMVSGADNSPYNAGSYMRRSRSLTSNTTANSASSSLDVVKEVTGNTTAASNLLYGPVDVALVLDTTGSMGSKLANVDSNMGTFVDALEKCNNNVRLGLVEFKDITSDGSDSTLNMGWFTNSQTFESDLNSITATGGGDEPETPIDGLEEARNMGFRSNATKLIILITDADYKQGYTDPNFPDVTYMSQEIGLLQSDNIIATVIGDPYYQSLYTDLYNETGGIYASIYDNFSSDLISNYLPQLSAGSATLGNCPYCLFGRDSVNLSTGNFIHQETDFDIPTEGPDLAFTRFYNSQDLSVGPQGRGWTSNLNAHLIINSDGSISVAYPDGHVYTFASSSGSYTAPSGCYETMTANAGGTYTLTFKDHTEYVFNSSGQLTSIVDKYGNSITLEYNSSSQLTSATDPTGNIFLTFNYTNNQLTSINDNYMPTHRSVSYTYNSNGELATVTGLDGGITQYQYDPTTGSLSAIIQPDGNTLFANTYNGSNQVATQTDGNGNTWTFNYNTGTADQTTMTGTLNSKADTTTYNYDSSYRALNLEDSLYSTTGKTISYQYGDSSHNPFLPTTVTSGDQKYSVSYTYTYDPISGNTLSCTNNGSKAETDYTYTNNNLASETVVGPNTSNVDSTTYTYYPSPNSN